MTSDSQFLLPISQCVHSYNSLLPNRERITLGSRKRLPDRKL